MKSEEHKPRITSPSLLEMLKDIAISCGLLAKLMRGASTTSRQQTVRCWQITERALLYSVVVKAPSYSLRSWEARASRKMMLVSAEQWPSLGNSVRRWELRTSSKFKLSLTLQRRVKQ